MWQEGKDVRGHRKLIPDDLLFASFDFLGGHLFSSLRNRRLQRCSWYLPLDWGHLCVIFSRGWRRAEVLGAS